MASIASTDTNAARLLRNYFESSFLERLDQVDIIGPTLTAKVIPPNSGAQADFHRIQNFNLRLSGLSAQAAAGEGFGSAHPSIHATAGQLYGRTYVVDSVTVGLDLVGDDLEITEKTIITSEPNPIPELSAIFMQEGTAIFAQRYMNILVCSSVNGRSNTATAPSINYNGASLSVGVVWGDGSATLTEATLDADNPTHRIAAESFNYATYGLRNARVQPIGSAGGFAGFISPGQAAELRLDSTFQELAVKNGQPGGIQKFEDATVGKIFGVRIMETPFVATNFPGVIDATNDEIHRGVVFGQGYAARVSYAAGIGRPRVNFIAPSPSAADVYGLNGYMSWKAYLGGVVLNPQCGRILKTATTNGSPSGAGDDGEWS